MLSSTYIYESWLPILPSPSYLPNDRVRSLYSLKLCWLCIYITSSKYVYNCTCLCSEWIIFADQTSAFMSICSDSFCFISSPPVINMLSWNSAQRWCSDNGTRLIEITNKDTQDAMSSFLNSIRSTYNYGGSNLFTNGKRESGSWSWLTGNTASKYL